MNLLLLGLLLFLGTHSIRIVANDWRTRRLARLGEQRWKGLYALLSLVGFVLIVWGYGQARAAPIELWQPPLWTRHLAALLTLPAFVLLVAAYVPGNRLKAALGHPMLAGTKLWAFAHLIANGTLADVVLFGAFLVWSTAAFVSSRRRDRRSGVAYPAQAGLTRDAVTVAVGLAVWVAFALWGHAWLIGVAPFGA